MGNDHFTRGMWEYFSLKRAEAKRIRKWPRERSKKEYKVSGSRNLHTGRSWSRPEEMKIWDAAKKSCGKANRNKELMGKNSKKNAE